jgi:ubiquinone/menaquinone biosynthesis C-methylase UbiE
MRFVVADGCDLPFEDDSFDYVHSSAVLEHVGSRERQARMLAESARVARKGVWHTTPNRWYPVELHTQLPFLHWLPPVRFRAFLRVLGHAELAREENLNLMTTRDLETACTPINGWHFAIRGHRLLGLSSNLLLAGWPEPRADR